MRPPQDTDDLLIVEDLDLSDESELRRIVADIQAFLRSPGRGLRVSVLSAEQWQTVITRWLPTQQRRGAAYYVHHLRDPRDPQHLLVSPSGVRGINERVRPIYQEIIYAILRSIPTELSGFLGKGLDDVVATLCGQKIGVDLYARVNPRAKSLVKALISVCVAEHGYGESDWALLMRSQPDRFFLALRKTRFCQYWIACALEDPALRPEIEEAQNKRAKLIELLRSEERGDGPVIEVTEQALAGYLDQLATKQNKKTAGSRR